MDVASQLSFMTHRFVRENIASSTIHPIIT